jgi:ankyrin repeat protein
LNHTLLYTKSTTQITKNKINWRNPDNHERTALMIASFRGQYRTVKWLVKEKGARVNGSDDLGCTALNLAARGGAPKVNYNYK